MVGDGRDGALPSGGYYLSVSGYPSSFGPSWTVNSGSTVSGTLRVSFATSCAGCGSADFNHDGDLGTDQDIQDFFSCLGGDCCPTCGSPDFDGDGDIGTDADIESFFRVLAGGPC